MPQQIFDRRERIWQRRHRLQRKPLVENQRIVTPAVIESGKCGYTFGACYIFQTRQRRDHVRHVVGAFEL